MSREILNALDELQPESGKRLPSYIITGMTRSLTRARYELMHYTRNPQGSGWIYAPRGGARSLMNRTGRASRRRLMALAAGREENFTYMLNTALLGGESYPVLTAVLGTAAGAASAGAGLLFTVATTALSLQQKSRRVLARAGDQLWQVEEIGKVRDSSLFGGSSVKAVHVGSYFLIDPFRQRVGGAHAKGWLIHEERQELTLV